jgi:hypothetical protein
MKRLMLLPAILPLLLFGPVGCGSDDDDGGTGPTATVVDDVVVSLDRITVDRDCDPSGGVGEFGYQFYVVLFDESGEIDRVLDSDWNSFMATDGDSWDPGGTASFRIERRPGMRFHVQLRVREFDGALEQFSQGTFVGHDGTTGADAWGPNDSGGVNEYTLYDSAQRVGIIDWDWWAADSCRGEFRYSVTATEVTTE